ncbi:exported hypothetical protein [Hyphomicrobiales bacterium]|nr:exported hypothetical protein [Hyphomicrobiales bacterium]CAH1669229.1 exported hypothetical protein [Hyphomicrobiales bacterium]
MSGSTKSVSVKFLAVIASFVALGANSAHAFSAPDCKIEVATTSGPAGMLTVNAVRSSTMGTEWLISGGGCEIYNVNDSTGTLGDRQTAAITITRPLPNLTQWRCQARSDIGRVESYSLRAIGIFCRMP